MGFHPTNALLERSIVLPVLSFSPLHFKRRLNDLWTLVFLEAKASGLRQCDQNNGKVAIMDVKLRLRR